MLSVVYAEYHLCLVSFMLSVIVPSVSMLSVIILSVIMLSVANNTLMLTFVMLRGKKFYEICQMLNVIRVSNLTLLKLVLSN
jgi:hypothetical protein